MKLKTIIRLKYWESPKTFLLISALCVEMCQKQFCFGKRREKQFHFWEMTLKNNIKVI